VGVSPPSCPHLTRRAYAAPLAGFAATGDVTPLIVNPAIMPFNLCMAIYFNEIVTLSIVPVNLLVSSVYSGETDVSRSIPTLAVSSADQMAN